MHLEFNFTEEDLIDFNLYHMAHSPTERRSIFTGRLVTALLVVIVAFSLVLSFGWHIDLLVVVSVLVGAIFAFMIYPRFLRRSAVRHIRKLLREGDNAAVFGPESMTFSQDGIFEKDAMGERRYNWSAVQRVVENGKHIFLYVSSTRALVIPTSAFESGAMKQEFLQLVKQYGKAGDSRAAGAL